MDLNSFLSQLSIAAIPIIFAITVHEVAHGWVARSFGDRTAEMQGRLTLNPIRHIDPIGTILVPALLLAFGKPMFGWARPVPVDPRNLRNPRPNMAVVAFAGPAANFAMAVFWALLMVAVNSVDLGVAGSWLYEMGGYGIAFNLIIGLFNLIPIPPLDGGQLLLNVLPQSPLTAILERAHLFGLLIVVVLLTMTDWLARLILPPLYFLLSMFEAVFGVQGHL